MTNRPAVPGSRLVLLLCGLLLSAWCAADTVVHERQAMFGTIVVTEDDGGVRTLRFGRSGPRQSVVKPGDPDHLVLQYTRSAFVGLALADAPRRMLVVGIGALQYVLDKGQEADWFESNAIVALSILSTLAPDEIARAIAAQDRATLSRPAGVGPKLAARLATELKDKAAAFGIAPAASAGEASAPVASSGSVNEDAVSALVNLGYKRVEAFGAVARATQRLGTDAKIDAVIRAALQELSR